jgi:hypothetical protein
VNLEKARSTASGMLEVHATCAAEVDGALTRAIEIVKAAAFEHQTGILVSRIAPGNYIVRAHPAVPFGLIRQRHDESGAT